jgi:cytoskeletal protein CcmA (bactofilin family)
LLYLLNQKDYISLKRNSSNETTSSLLKKDLAIQGNLVFNGSLDIQGIVIGDINEVGSSKSLLVVQKDAKVKGKIDCTSVIVIGKVHGDIHADHLKIEKGSEVIGNCIYKSIEVHYGAQITGGLFIKNEKFLEDISLPKNKKVIKTIELNHELSHITN